MAKKRSKVDKETAEFELKEYVEHNQKFRPDAQWVGIKSSGAIGFIVKELDGGARYYVLLIWNVKGDSVVDAFRVFEKDDITFIEDPEMIRVLYAKTEKD